MMYMDKMLTVEKEEMLSGQLNVRPNEKNPRDIDISVHYKFDGKSMAVDYSQEYRLR